MFVDHLHHFTTHQHSAVHMRALVAVTTFHFATCSLGGNLLHQSDAGFSTAEGGGEGVESRPSDNWTTTPTPESSLPLCVGLLSSVHTLYMTVLNVAAIWPFLTHRGEVRSFHIFKLIISHSA